MNWINKIAYHRGIRDEEPNKELAKELADTNNVEGIKEISEYLYDKNKSISSDCISVLYTIGYTKPGLIEGYDDTFLKLLESKINRMVWGAMIALANIAELKAEKLFENIDLLLATMKKGTLITEVWGIKALANVLKANKANKAKILPVLFDYLEKCRPIDFASRVEVIYPVVTDDEEKMIFNKIIEMKMAELSPAQHKKLVNVIKKQEKEKR